MPEPNRRWRIWGWHPGQPPIGLLILVFALQLAATIPATALDLDEMTVVTMAGDGSWGMAAAASASEAIAGAIRACKAWPDRTGDQVLLFEIRPSAPI
jgi:hypothetical protein